MPRGPWDGEVKARWWGGRRGYASAAEFYRDLLLMCANTLVFFPRGSLEHSVATRKRARRQAHVQGPATTLGEGHRAVDGGQEGQGRDRRRVPVGEGDDHHHVPKAELYRQGRSGDGRQGEGQDE